MDFSFIHRGTTLIGAQKSNKFIFMELPRYNIIV